MVIFSQLLRYQCKIESRFSGLNRIFEHFPGKTHFIVLLFNICVLYFPAIGRPHNFGQHVRGQGEKGFLRGMWILFQQLLRF